MKRSPSSPGKRWRSGPSTRRAQLGKHAISGNQRNENHYAAAFVNGSDGTRTRDLRRDGTGISSPTAPSRGSPSFLGAPASDQV